MCLGKYVSNLLKHTDENKLMETFENFRKKMKQYLA